MQIERYQVTNGKIYYICQDENEKVVYLDVTDSCRTLRQLHNLCIERGLEIMFHHNKAYMELFRIKGGLRHDTKRKEGDNQNAR